MLTNDKPQVRVDGTPNISHPLVGREFVARDGKRWRVFLRGAEGTYRLYTKGATHMGAHLTLAKEISRDHFFASFAPEEYKTFTREHPGEPFVVPVSEVGTKGSRKKSKTPTFATEDGAFFSVFHVTSNAVPVDADCDLMALYISTMLDYSPEFLNSFGVELPSFGACTNHLVETSYTSRERDAIATGANIIRRSVADTERIENIVANIETSAIDSSRRKKVVECAMGVLKNPGLFDHPEHLFEGKNYAKIVVNPLSGVKDDEIAYVLGIELDEVAALHRARDAWMIAKSAAAGEAFTREMREKICAVQSSTAGSMDADIAICELEFLLGNRMQDFTNSLAVPSVSSAAIFRQFIATVLSHPKDDPWTYSLHTLAVLGQSKDAIVDVFNAIESIAPADMEKIATETIDYLSRWCGKDYDTKILRAFSAIRTRLRDGVGFSPNLVVYAEFFSSLWGLWNSKYLEFMVSEWGEDKTLQFFRLALSEPSIEELKEHARDVILPRVDEHFSIMSAKMASLFELFYGRECDAVGDLADDGYIKPKSVDFSAPVRFFTEGDSSGVSLSLALMSRLYGGHNPPPVDSVYESVKAMQAIYKPGIPYDLLFNIAGVTEDARYSRLGY